MYISLTQIELISLFVSEEHEGDRLFEMMVRESGSLRCPQITCFRTHTVDKDDSDRLFARKQ